MAEELKLIAVARVRGVRNMKPKIRHTLHLMGLNKPNHLVVFKDSPSIRGMLNIVKDYVTFGFIDEDTLKALVKKRGYRGRKRFSELGDKSVDEAVKAFLEKGERLFERVFRLHPPRKGWKDVKKSYRAGGALGERPDMVDVVRRMM